MRKGPTWMTKSDDSILEVFEDLDCALSLRGIEVNSERMGRRIPYTTIQGRIVKLVDAGLVTTIDEKAQWYVITEEGSAYLAGDHVPPELD